MYQELLCITKGVDNMSFTAQNRSIYDLFNRNCYYIPRNQRKYVWTNRNWKDLYEDVMLVYNKVEKTHFVGSVVLVCEKERENGISRYTIIDGQQRIMTLAIMLSSIAFWLKCYSAENEFNGTKQYIVARDDSDKDHMMMTSEYHMSLERILSAIASYSIDELKVLSIEGFLKQNTVSKRDRNIVAAFRFYINQIASTIQQIGEKPIDFLVGFRDAILNKILYVSIIATSEEDAYTIFEILNARGLALEDHELLKNFIMRGLEPEGDVDKAKMIWNEIENDLGGNICQFVKHYATHRYSASTSSGISDYQTIKLKNKGLPTQELLYDIRLKTTFYCKLINPCISEDGANCSDVEYMVYSFFKKRRHEQIRPILLSLIHQKEIGILSTSEYEKTILFLYDFFVCYNIIGQANSNKITNIVHSMANELENDYSNKILQQLIYKLNSKLPTKENFINAFSTVGWSHHGGFYDDDKDKERVQIILEVLERHKNASGRCDVFTIEHILDDYKNVQNGKIGNLIPLEERLNKQCEGKSYEEKIAIYQKSSFCTARNIAARYKSLDDLNIDTRTEHMANEIYDRVLKFKISDAKNEVKNKPPQRITSQAVLKNKTIGEMVDGKKIDEEYTQLTLFDTVN